jgi:apolipoprotein N-acyltransferase
MIAAIWLPPAPPVCLPVAFAPLIVVWHRASRLRDVFATGWVAAIVASAIAFFWVIETVRDRFGSSLSVAVGSWVLTALGANIRIPIAGVLWVGLTRLARLSRGASFAVLPLLWVALETALPQLLPFHYGYPWLWSGLPVSQIADVVGCQGLSLVTLGLGSAVAYAWVVFRNERFRGAAVLVTMALTFAALNYVGTTRRAAWQATDRALRARLVQPNLDLGSVTASGTESRRLVLETLLAGSLAVAPAASQADVWIWPEGALPLALGQHEFLADARALEAILRRTGTPLLTGAFTVDATGKYNSLVAYSKGERIATYQKQRLFPFGERLPGAGFIAALRRYDSVQQGSGPDAVPLVDAAGVSVAPSVCWEILFPSLTRKSVERGAEVLVNVSSDRPFGDFAEPFQHLYMAIGRALEFRRPLVRVATTGVSAVVSADGKVVGSSPHGVPWAETLEVAFRSNPPATRFQQWGDTLVYVWLAAAALICGADRLRQRYSDRVGVSP